MNREKNELEQLRHSSAHLLAQAINELYPGTLFTIGPATEQGFFYDFLPPTNLSESDLPAIEARMHELAAQNIPITHRLISKEEARTLFRDNPFKLELIDQIEGEKVGIAEQGSFVDLCRGGHVASTGDIKHFILLGLSGSYWRGKKENAQLQRITGTAFLTAQEFEDFKKHREDALKYDHRKLGKELDLFSLHPEGPGFPFFHPKGMLVVNELKGFMRSLLEKYGYREVSTPTILNEELWKRSGHYNHYREIMYFLSIDDKGYAVKPMSCPGAFLIYKNRPRSYRELPMRLSEFGHVHRHELSGVLHGLMRVRAFTQDDAHIFCTLSQAEAEIKRVLEMIFITMEKMGFKDLKIVLATRPENAMGSEEQWKLATEALRKALDASGRPYSINEGEGAFYGPKIEIHFEDSMGRSWQCGTIQVDLVQPENFDLSFVTPSGTKERVIVIHHAIYGSLERFLAVLLEHYKGHLPFWLAPIQVRVLPITEKEVHYAEEIAQKLRSALLRVEVDTSSDALSGKIKEAQLDRIPWMLVIGAKEAAAQTVTLRKSDGSQEFGLTIDTLLERAKALSK
ncbi:MAG: threonine--tRNA ligase [Candidatus Babeliaceae bacterium]|nr:threonine--tRNA ligase [Candidatus Babeliaceae bacterium]